MCQEPTELLWIAVWQDESWFWNTNSIINSQTFWPEVISYVDEWYNLLHLFNTSHFCSTCCFKNSSLMSCTKTMAKRMQEQKEEERIVAKSLIYSVELVLSWSDSSAKNPIASKSPGELIATGKPESRMRRIQNLTQRRVLKWSCKLHTLVGWWRK